MRTSSVAALSVMLSACGEPQPAATQAVPDTEHAEKVPCARGREALSPVCTLLREPSAKGEIWTIRFPDGGFRRLRVEGDVVSAADGAERLRAVGDDVTIAGERYRLPDE